MSRDEIIASKFFFRKIYPKSFHLSRKSTFLKKNFYFKNSKILDKNIFKKFIFQDFGVKMPKCKFLIFYDFCDFFQVSSISGSKIPKIEAPLVAKRGIRQSQPLGGKVALN